MTIEINSVIYNDACVSKCVYSFLNEVSIERRLIGESEFIDISPKCAINFNTEDFRHRFLERLNDYKLRDIVAEETKDIRTLLYATAFMDGDNLNID